MCRLVGGDNAKNCLFSTFLQKFSTIPSQLKTLPFWELVLSRKQTSQHFQWYTKLLCTVCLCYESCNSCNNLFWKLAFFFKLILLVICQQNLIDSEKLGCDRLQPCLLNGSTEVPSSITLQDQETHIRQKFFTRLARNTSDDGDELYVHENVYWKRKKQLLTMAPWN